MRATALPALVAMSWGLAHSQTITFRRLASTSLPSNASFAFDGTNSDIAQELYIRYRGGNTMDAVELESIPAAVADRLDPFRIAFNDLPGLVQLAVLWDSGFAISPGNEAVQMWTMDGHSMADLAVSRTEASNAGCTFVDCVQPNNVTASYVQGGTGGQMLSVSRCVVDTFADSTASEFLGAMWSNGGDSDKTPHIRLRDHSWTDPETNIPYSVYAVHTVPSTDDVTWNQCPPSGEYASLTIPCYRRDNLTSEEEAAMTTPSGSAWITTWLEQEFAEEDKSGFDALLLIPIIAGAVVAFGAFGLGWLCWRRRVERKEQHANDLHDGSAMYCNGDTPELALHPTDRSSRQTTQETSLSSNHKNYNSAGANRTLKILLGSKHLKGRRLPYESLVFERAMSKGASGEVWICDYNGQSVAAKRLLQTKDQKAEDVQAFAEEIELSASLVHPHIVEFVGVAWSSLNNLVLVLEFCPEGNLQSYLHRNRDLLSWARDKIHIAVGVAQALGYLHACTPPVIHRDLKSNNVLLTDKLEPKVIDFGVSRGLVDLTMTAGVGTPYWTAPEILEGKRYTEKADIYSFGVVLSELDTGKIPYFEAATKRGNTFKPFQILQGVMAGRLRPSFAEDCPAPDPATWVGLFSAWSIQSSIRTRTSVRA